MLVRVEKDLAGQVQVPAVAELDLKAGLRVDLQVGDRGEAKVNVARVLKVVRVAVQADLKVDPVVVVREVPAGLVGQVAPAVLILSEC